MSFYLLQKITDNDAKETLEISNGDLLLGTNIQIYNTN